MSKKKSKSLLPKGFKSLEKWVDMWVLPDSQARTEQRHAADYDDLKAFYDDMFAKAEKALAYLQEKQLGELDEREERLLKLMLSLAEIGPSVEWYQQNAVVDGFPPERFKLTVQIPDNVAQGV
ncbi:MAG: hypothetical protein AAF387_05940 [Pseudomonadota bacterium]